jgi:hypothetical protein
MNGGIRWVALMEGRESVNGGRYDWAEASEGIMMKIWRRKHVFGRRGLYFLVWIFSGLEFG